MKQILYCLAVMILLSSCLKDDINPQSSFVISAKSTSKLASVTLLAHWPFDGNGNDISANGNNATLYNLTPATDRFGDSARAYYFNGSSSYALVPDNIALRLNNTNFTLNAWVKLDSYNSSYGSVILSKHIAGANNGWGWSINGYASSPVGAVFYGPGGGSTNAVSASTVSVGSWHMLTSVYNASTGQLSTYIDSAYSNTVSGILTSNGAITAALNIGKDAAGNNYFFHGSLDDIRIYGSALTSSEIQELYKSTSYGLVANWPFDGNGSDVSGNSNTATLHNLSSTTDRFGSSTGAYYFNGINSYASVSDNAELRLNNTNFTLNAWMKLDSYNSSYGSIILSKHIAGANNGWGWSINGYASSPIGAVFYGPGGGSTNAVSTSIFGLGSWHMVTSIYNKSTGQLSTYIDGVFSNSVSGILTANGAISAALNIGKDSAGNNYFLQGALDDVRIYKRALSYSEILQLL